MESGAAHRGPIRVEIRANPELLLRAHGAAGRGSSLLGAEPAVPCDDWVVHVGPYPLDGGVRESIAFYDLMLGQLCGSGGQRLASTR